MSLIQTTENRTFFTGLRGKENPQDKMVKLEHKIFLGKNIG
jgi:hypothetical protein